MHAMAAIVMQIRGIAHPIAVRHALDRRTGLTASAAAHPCRKDVGSVQRYPAEASVALLHHPAWTGRDLDRRERKTQDPASGSAKSWRPRSVMIFLHGPIQFLRLRR